MWFLMIAICAFLKLCASDDYSAHSAFMNPLDFLPELVNKSSTVADHELIICAGFGHTGTRSISKYLKKNYGMRSHHYDSLSVSMVKGHGLELEDFNWSIYDNVDAVSDIPIPEFFLELMVAYPKSKVILTVRNVTEWTAVFKRKRRDMLELKECSSRTLFSDYSSPIWVKSAVRYAQYGTPCPSPLQMAKRYLLHNRAVISIVPPERLLVLDIIGGNEPQNKLASFLGKAVPAPEFENINGLR